MAGKGRARGRIEARCRRFLREWGVYLLIGAAIVAIFVLLGRSRGGVGLATETPYRVYFTQGDAGHPKPSGLEAELVADVAAAGQWIEVAAPGLDLPQLAEALMAAHKRGVRVQVVENETSQEDPAVLAVTTRLREAGIPVLLRPRLGGSFLVVDGRVTWAGSWDLSRQGLEGDGLVLRWEIPTLATDFHAEFTEMTLETFAGGLFRPPTALRTPYPYLAIPDGASISVYMTPEEAALSEVLQTLARAQDEIIVLGELNDPRLGDRLIGEASLATMLTVWAVVDENGSSPDLLRALVEREVNLGIYTGTGKLYENVLVADGQSVIVFSQPMDQEAYDYNDGYVLIVRDQGLGQTLQKEFSRLYVRAKKQP